MLTLLTLLTRSMILLVNPVLFTPTSQSLGVLLTGSPFRLFNLKCIEDLTIAYAGRAQNLDVDHGRNLLLHRNLGNGTDAMQGSSASL